MKHTVHVRQHSFAIDEPAANGGEDEGFTPHDVYDSALGACKAMTVLWYAQRKQIPVEDIQVNVERDDVRVHGVRGVREVGARGVSGSHEVVLVSC